MASRIRLWDRQFSWILPVGFRHWLRPGSNNGRQPERRLTVAIRFELNSTRRADPGLQPQPRAPRRNVDSRSAPAPQKERRTPNVLRCLQRLCSRTNARPNQVERVERQHKLRHIQPVERTYRSSEPMTEQTQEHSWIRLEDGQSTQFKILSATPTIHTLHWVQGQAQEHHEQNCTWCAANIRKSVRYTVPIQSQEGADRWEMASLTWKDLQAIQKAVGSIENLMIDLSRRGIGRQTRYTIVALGNISLPTSPTAPAQPAWSPEPDNRDAIDESNQAPNQPVYQTEPIVAASPITARTYDEEVANVTKDPDGAKAYIFNMCRTLELLPGTVITDQQKLAKEFGKPTSAVHIMASVIQDLEQQVADEKAPSGADIDAALEELLQTNDE